METLASRTSEHPIVTMPGVPFKPYYESGGVTIYHADCRQVLPFLPRFGLLLTDPPYGIGEDKGKGGGGFDGSGRWRRKPKKYLGEWDAERPQMHVIETALALCNDAIIWGGNYFADELGEATKWLFWDKLNSMPTYSDGEIAWTTLAGCATKKFTQCNNGLASLRDGSRVHPTQKPLNLMQWCIGLVPEALSVLDPFMGSGTTLVAARLEGRIAVGIEISEEYCEAAVKRLAQDVLF